MYPSVASNCFSSPLYYRNKAQVVNANIFLNNPKPTQTHTHKKKREHRTEGALH